MMREGFSTAIRRHRPALLALGLFGFAINILMLTGPLFMLQVYDRVLTSRSEPTLVAFSVLVASLYGFMAALDLLRTRIATRIAARLQADLDGDVFRAVLSAPSANQADAATGLSDLEAVRRFVASSLFLAIFDIPFAPLFLLILFGFHPLLGWFALAAAAVLVGVMALNQRLSRAPAGDASVAQAKAARLFATIRAEAETVNGLGMYDSLSRRWRQNRNAALQAETTLAEVNGVLGSLSRVLRLFIQSALLAVGAWLVLGRELNAGAIVASSVIFGRAIAPVEQLVGGWATIERAVRGRAALRRLIASLPAEPRVMALPRPADGLQVSGLTVVPPGLQRATLAHVSLTLAPGQVMGVVGGCAAGKSSLARALVGLWRPFAGEVRLGGARLNQYSPEALARHVGYLPQTVSLFQGTVAENIARMSDTPDAAAVMDAARLAGAHEMILDLAKGYDTDVGEAGAALSGGQRQRIALARALYGNPVLVVLDEPNASLDESGSQALNAAIRTLKARGVMTVVIAHRPSVLADCDLILSLKGGRVDALEPNAKLLRTAAPRVVWATRRTEGTVA